MISAARILESAMRDLPQQTRPGNLALELFLRPDPDVFRDFRLHAVAFAGIDDRIRHRQRLGDWNFVQEVRS